MIERLQAARAAGVSLQTIATASNLTLGTVLSFLNGQVLPPSDYRSLERGLARLEKQAEPATE